MATITALSGMPGSGKSTLLLTATVPVVSSDGVAEEIRGECWWFGGNGSDVWEEVYRRVASRLANGQSLVVDSTGGKATRERLLTLSEGHVTRLIVLDIPPAVAAHRNRTRFRRVPDAACERMADRHKALITTLTNGRQPDTRPWREILVYRPLVNRWYRFTRSGLVPSAPQTL